MKKFILCITSLVVFFSCQKVLDLDAETKTPKLVVNSLFNDQNSWEVKVTKSLSVLDNGNLTKVENAIVSIYDGATLVSNLTYDGEKYAVLGLSAPPTPGKEYRVEVSAPNFTSILARDFCPLPVAIISADTTSVTTTFDQKEQTVTLKFQDPAGIDNFYGIQLDLERYYRIFNNSQNRWDTTLNYTDRMYLSSSNPIVDNSGPDSYSQTLTLKDNLTDGQLQTITFSYTNYNSVTTNEFEIKKIKLLSFTENTYKYSKSIETYQSVEGNPFAEPVQVFTNIEGGFGIFGGQSLSEISF